MKLLIYFLIPAFVWAADGNDSSNIIKYKSAAFDLGSNKFLYYEHHIEEYSKSNILKSVTEYVDLNGKSISKRIMTFSDDSTKPNFKLDDFRTGYLEGAETIEQGKVKVIFREDKDEKLETKILRIAEPYVIDGGLTFFFRENWTALLNNKTIEFNFVTPSKLDYFKFRVMKEGIKVINGITGMVLKLEPASFIIRQFVDPIYITYDLETRKILFYEGLSNINNEEGKSYNVKIDFTKKEME